MISRWTVVLPLVVCVAVSLLASGAAAPKVGASPGALSDRPPHGLYECWPAEDEAAPGSLT